MAFLGPHDLVQINPEWTQWSDPTLLLRVIWKALVCLWVPPPTDPSLGVELLSHQQKSPPDSTITDTTPCALCPRLPRPAHDDSPLTFLCFSTLSLVTFPHSATSHTLSCLCVLTGSLAFTFRSSFIVCKYTSHSSHPVRNGACLH